MYNYIKQDLEKYFTKEQILFLLKCLFQNYVVEELADNENSTPDMIYHKLMVAAGLYHEDLYNIRKGLRFSP